MKDGVKEEEADTEGIGDIGAASVGGGEEGSEEEEVDGEEMLCACSFSEALWTSLYPGHIQNPCLTSRLTFVHQSLGRPSLLLLQMVLVIDWMMPSGAALVS